MANTVREMILLSVRGLEIRDKDASAKLYEMDDTVDALYRKYLREIIARDDQVREKADPRCYISALLILRYLERISDHACYIGDSIRYSTTGISSPRR
jgi:phosphate transport system protein